MGREEYRISELAEKSGVTRRTIHYYMARGLLPPPDGAGLGTTYREEHLARILLIKRWQDAFWPLEQIKKQLTSMTYAQVQEMIGRSGTEPPPIPKDGNGWGLPSEPELPNGTSTPQQQGKLGIAYQRITIAHGVEIHVPSNDPKAQQLANQLYAYAEKLLKEG
jgi:DNA-binding transcriptional MerR regulator